MKTSNICSNRTAYHLTIALLLALIAFGAYLPVLQNGFIWDDTVYVYENHTIQSIDIRLLYWDSSVILWHPLTMLSLAIDNALWGLNPKGYHITNNFIHAMNTFLVFMLAVQVAGWKTPGQNTTNKNTLIVGSVTALLFGVHPLHVESVAWISERKDLLCAFFFLLTLLAYLKYINSDTKAKRIGRYALCLALFILALLSKPMAVTLPLVLLVLDFYPLRRLTIKGLGDSKGVLIEKTPFFLLSFIFSIITICTNKAAGPLPIFIAELPFTARLLSSVHSYIFYLAKVVIPFNLAPFYPFPDKIALNLEYLGSLILLSSVTSAALWSSKRNKVFVSTWLYYLLTLMPVTGIVQVGEFFAADRYTYLPSLGPFLLAGMGIGFIYEKCLKKRDRLILIITIVILSVILTGRTMRQELIWHDNITLWSHEIKLYPGSALAYNNRGAALDSIGDYRRAIMDYNRAIELNPLYTDAYHNQGIAYMRMGNYPSAIRDFNMIVILSPQEARAYYNLGTAYMRSGDSKQAAIYYKKASGLGWRQ